MSDAMASTLVAPARPSVGVEHGRSHWRLAANCAVLWLACACTSTVVPPPSPEDPVVVFVLSEALHTGVVLPPDATASGNPDEYVEFGYGDWGWYALGNDSWYNTFATMLWPTQGALGRRTFGAKSMDQLRRRTYWAQMSPIVVSRKRASALRHRLQAEFDGRRKRVVINRNYGFKFVPTPYSYWLPNNCADLAVEWLEELGCEVWWCPLRMDLVVGVRDDG